MMRREDVDELSIDRWPSSAIQSYRRLTANPGSQEQAIKERWKEGKQRHREVGWEELGRK